MHSLMAAGLFLLLHAGSPHGGGGVEGSVTNTAADFLGSLQPPEPSEFRLRSDWVTKLPYDMDEILLMAPPDMPEALQDPYFKRVDFQLSESTAKRWIKDENLLGETPFYRGPALPGIDPLMRASPFKGRDGPFALPTQSFLTSTASLPLGHNFNLRQTHHSGVDKPFEREYGDIPEFLEEASSRIGLTGDQARPVGIAYDAAQLPNPFDAFELPHMDVGNSRTASAMRSQIDFDIVHPDDRIKLGNRQEPDSLPPLQPGLDMSGGARSEGTQEGFAVRTETEFDVDKFSLPLECAKEPLMMQHKRAAHFAKHNPSTDLTLQPVVTGVPLAPSPTRNPKPEKTENRDFNPKL
jgi:hypothetical protein